MGAWAYSEGEQKMSRVAILTDSNSGISPQEAQEMGVFVVPMPFTINDKEYFEDISITKEDFYEMLRQDCKILTSQPTVGTLMDTWDKLLETHDEVVYIPMSSGLSGSCETATLVAGDYDGKVFVVNNQRISITQMDSAMFGKQLADLGYTGSEIYDILTRDKFESSIYIMVDTLKYLRKGGRVTPAGAALGALLNIKPVLQIQGGKLDAFSRCRGIKQARKIMVDAVDKDLRERFTEPFVNKQILLYAVHTRNFEAVEELRRELAERYPGIHVGVAELSLSISCHIGPGALAVGIDVIPAELQTISAYNVKVAN